MNSGNTNQSKSGWLGIGGAFAPVMPLDIRGSTTESFWVRNGTTYFFAGADNANKRARIGAYEEGVGWKNLIINEGGGNVGIGTTSPGAKLDVGVGASQCCAAQTPNISLAQASNTNGNMSWLQFHNAGESEAYIRLAGGGAGIRAGQRRLEIGDSQGVLTGLTVTGNVGIGTTSPGAKLDVAGGVIQRGIIPYGVGGDSGGSSAGNDYAFGYQEAGSWTYPYPDLILGYHTGIKIGGYWNYNGVRFYNDHPSRAGATEIFSVGNGDSNVRVVNNLIVSGQVQTTGGIRFNDGTTQTSAAGGGFKRKQIPTPFSGSFSGEANLRDGNSNTYAEDGEAIYDLGVNGIQIIYYAISTGCCSGAGSGSGDSSIGVSNDNVNYDMLCVLLGGSASCSGTSLLIKPYRYLKLRSYSGGIVFGGIYEVTIVGE